MMVRLGFQPCLHELAERARLFEQSDLAGDGILGAVHPGIVVIAADHPLVGILRRREFVAITS